MAMPIFSMRDLIEAGVHFGHKTKRWNPQMAPFIYGVRHDTHIIDLGQTVPMLHRALAAVREVAAAGGKILFVGTKRQASEIVAEAAKSCGQYYINERWLGGLMTNWQTIQNSIRRLKEIEKTVAEGGIGLTKKEILNLERARLKLESSLGGIKTMNGQPDLLFIVDTHLEDLAVKEANKLNIPIVGIVDTNATVQGISFPVPGNDDATRAIQLYCDLIAGAILEGRQSFAAAKGVEISANGEISEADMYAGRPQRENRNNRNNNNNKARQEEQSKDKKQPAKSTTKKEEMAALAKKAEDSKAASEDDAAA
jgi:small subunit ribosomal protein S2